jgi:hypothetical protein
MKYKIFFKFKIMKKLNKYLISIIVFGGIIGLISCNDDFLERGPLSKINDALFWKTPNDLEIYINNLYNKASLLTNYNSSRYDVIGPYTDDAFSGSDILIQVDYNKRMNGENVLPTSGGGWQISNWEVLRNINYFMAHYQRVDADFSQISKYVGEALFFRSIFYFDKLKRFGAVPWTSSLLNPDSEELFGNRHPRNIVVDSIMADLDRAVEYLPARGNGIWTGRITKETALALQARIALYEGTWEKYHDLKNTPFKVLQDGDKGTRFLQKAVAATDSLIKMAELNNYPGLDNVGQTDGYWNLFNQKDYSSSKEVLFWRKYSTDAEQLFNRWINISYTGAGVGITKRLVDLYLCSDGKPIYVAPNTKNVLYQGDDDLLSVAKNRDPRLSQTICIPDGKHYKWKPDVLFERPMITAELGTRCVTGYQLYKGHSADKTEYDNRKGTNGCIYFRYAEVLLINAEAKAELGIITQTDIDKTINLLRNRVGMPELDINNIQTDPYWLFTTTGAAAVSPLLQEIRRERTVELACEGFRVDDIFRWAAADELIVNYRPKGAKLSQWPETQSSPPEYLNEDSNGYIDPYAQYAPMENGYLFNLKRDYLYPIPTNELTLNPALRPQNPGW